MSNTTTNEILITIKAKNYKEFQTLIDKLPKPKSPRIVYSNGRVPTIKSNSSRERRLKKILTMVNRKPCVAYTSDVIHLQVREFGVTIRTINRDLAFLSLKKLIILDNYNHKSLCAKHEKAISDYKKLRE